MRTKRIWTVVHSTDHDTDAVARFGNAKDAENFAHGKRHYSEPAKPFVDDVPLNIAKRWGF